MKQILNKIIYKIIIAKFKVCYIIIIITNYILLCLIGDVNVIEFS